MTRLTGPDGVGYEAHERGAGPVLVLLHGFAGTSRTWDAVAAALGVGRRWVAIDLLGHGGSDAPPAPRHAAERQAADVAAMLAARAEGPVDVLGYSFGARVALWLAVTAPESVARLVLESPSAGIADPVERSVRAAADERWARVLESGDMAAFHDAWEAQPLFHSRAALPRDIREMIRADHLAADGPSLARSLRGAGQGVMTPLHDRLRDIHQPALVIAGALDPVGSERAAQVARLLPQSRLRVIEGAGHTPHLERPDGFIEQVTAFLVPAVAGAVAARGEP